ncbi:MAG TPA: hypothetical protein VFS20_27920 [Longimicrobium sp.]|nr:hypothetical protein [Longimicrobium sp.]
MSSPIAFAPRPPSEIEWEELLVRYEIGPRALRIALDDGDANGPARQRACDLLRALVFNELWTAAQFEAMRAGIPVSDDQSPRTEVLPDEPRALIDRFERLRSRNFAAVQRRGLEVWGWHTEAHPHGQVTAHQLIQASVALDGETLASVREALRGAGVG